MALVHTIRPNDVCDSNIIQASHLRSAKAAGRATIRSIGSVFCLFLCLASSPVSGQGFEICTVAANCQKGLPGVIGGALNNPNGISVDSSGNVVVSDYLNHRIQKFDGNGNFLLAFGQDVVDEGPNVDNGFEICTTNDTCKAGVENGAAGAFARPIDVAASGGKIYIAGNRNPRVHVFNVSPMQPQISFLQMWGKDVDTSGDITPNICTDAVYCQTGSLGAAGQELNFPDGIALDGTSSVYVSERGGLRVQKFDANGNFLRAWGKDVVVGGTTDFEICTPSDTCKSGASGSSVAGAFQRPRAVGVDSSGNVYVASQLLARIQKFDANGNFVRMWGKNVDTSGDATPNICEIAANCTSGANGSEPGALNNPYGLAIDGNDNVYVTDGWGPGSFLNVWGHRIQKFDANGNFILEWGSYGVGAGQFDFPARIAVDGAFVYVTEFNNHRVQKFDSTGNFLRMWGRDVNAGPNPVSVTIEPGAFAGQWTIRDEPLDGLSSTLSGTQNLTLEPGTYRIIIGEGNFLFDVAVNGSVASQNASAATGGSGVLTFNTQNVTVDPVNYSSRWAISRGVHSQAGGGLATIALVQTLDYAFAVGEGTFGFNVGATGLVTESSDAATGGQNTLTLENVLVTVDPAAYLGDWGFGRGILSSTGGVAESVNLVPALRYSIQIANISRFNFDMDGAGNVNVLNGISATGGAQSLTFNTVTIFVDVGTFSANWAFSRASALATGNGSTDLVPSIDYTFDIDPGGSQQVSVSDNPCSVDPTSFALDGHDFNLTCGAPDDDLDGIPNSGDNCPNVYNPDQLDQDLDLIGDVCDPDLDGDGIDNTDDNCPDVANPGQENLDGDADGDACDDDTDGDSVPDATDNCPLDPNIDQGDNDGDAVGDVCDPDDDNDTVLDVDDNCPLTANVDQTDSDGDGQGDICDGDVDGDGVANGSDLCPLSPQGQPVNSNGCTGPQLIALQCVCEDYVQHGQYVSCVAHTANDAVAQGLMAPNEKAQFVKEAAKNKCN